MDISKIGKSCTGCRVCEQLCPQQCISMKANAEGFLYPFVNNTKCTNCGMCLSNCPNYQQNRKESTISLIPIAYAAMLTNREKLLVSSSGGAFTGIAEYVLSQGGSVFGCTIIDNFKIQHIKITQNNELPLLRGSKYVQSDTGSTFIQTKELLERGEYVLYSGTPCQIAGLYAFLHKDYEKLITVDLVCHGVPSPKLFLMYIDWISQKFKEPLIGYEFRNKERNGWGKEYKAKTKTKTKYCSASMDPYYSAFMKAENYRECCYLCHYASSDRVGDFTIGDFWGVEKFHPELNGEEKLGISLLIVNSLGAMKILENVKDSLILYPSTIENAKTLNSSLVKPAVRPVIRDTFYIDINIKGFDWYAQQFYRSNAYYYALIKSFIPSSIKLAIKNVLFKK